MATDIVLKDRNGNDVVYEGIETVTFDTTTEGVQSTFTLGTEQTGKEVEPDFSAGDQTVTAAEGKLLKSLVLKKPASPEGKIAKGETLMGMTGTYVTPGTSKAVELDFSEVSETVILAETTGEFTYNADNDGTTAAIENSPAASAIVAGETYNVIWDGATYECTAQSIEDYGVGLGDLTLFGGSGNSEPFAMVALPAEGFELGCFTDTADASHTFSITQCTAAQTITAIGDERWDKVIIPKPETLVPENIQSGVNIAGIIGEKKPYRIWSKTITGVSVTSTGSSRNAVKIMDSSELPDWADLAAIKKITSTGSNNMYLLGLVAYGKSISTTYATWMDWVSNLSLSSSSYCGGFSMGKSYSPALQTSEWFGDSISGTQGGLCVIDGSIWFASYNKAKILVSSGTYELILIKFNSTR